MESSKENIIGKILYGSIFVVLLPILLIMWSIYADKNVKLPIIETYNYGLILALIGVLISALGMLNLKKYGKGLPMNAFPPKFFVKEGIYQFLAHPIYFGTCLLVLGLSLYFKSPAGLWLVSPVFILLCFAYVIGFEKEIIEMVFGKVNYSVLLGLPNNSTQNANIWNKLSFYFLSVIPWFVIYESFVYLGTPNKVISILLPFEKNIPILDFTIIFYISIYPLILILPFILKRQDWIRELIITSSFTNLLGFISFSCFPFISPFREFNSTSYFGNIILLERANDSIATSFPAFHAIWAFIFAYFISKKHSNLKILSYIFAILISVSCITTGMHSLLDIIFAFFVFLVAIKWNKIWKYLLNKTEQIANSWKEWHFANVRIINHGTYAAIGAFIGLFITTSIMGAEYFTSILIVGTSSLICAALWAQFVEGSPKLLRPFGFYGCVIGIEIGSLIAYIFYGTNFFFISAAFAIGAPWIQILGRLRCLVQGCCHGKPCTEELGIKYNNDKSRVVVIANLKNELLHPTQLYSMLFTIPIGLFLARLWYSEAGYPMITGMYFILTGITRFVEEGFRGEPQTKIISGLRLYQWTAIFAIVIGAICTTIPSVNLNVHFSVNPNSFILAIFFALLTKFVMGVDFPKSNKRFSRLV